MASTSQRPKDCVFPTLDVFIQLLNIAKDTCGIPPAQVAFISAGVLLTMIRVGFPLLGDEKLTDLGLLRTQWLTIRIMSSLDGFAVMYAKCSTED
jgi:hypothetical protein